MMMVVVRKVQQKGVVLSYICSNFIAFSVCLFVCFLSSLVIEFEKRSVIVMMMMYAFFFFKSVP